MKDYWLVLQRLAVSVDVAGECIKGYSEIELTPQDKFCKSVRLHCRQCRVKSVTVNGVNAEFEFMNFMDNIVSEQYYDHAAFDLFYRGSLIASNEGEMIVSIPEDVKIEEDMSALESLPPPVPVDSSSELEDFADKRSTRIPRYRSLVLRVVYELLKPKGSCFFMLPDERNPERVPHMYACGSRLGGLCDGARTWFPCRDTLLDRCPFELQITVPMEHLAISSGCLVDQVVDNEAGCRTFFYRVEQPVSANSICLAVGPFVAYPDPNFPMITHFCLPGKEEELKHTTSNVAYSVKYFEKFLGVKYPHGSYQQVFVENPPDNMIWAASAAILDHDVLHSPAIMDVEMASHLLQVKAVLGSWLSCTLGLQSSKDAWVLIGLIEYLLNLYVKKALGPDEYRFRLQVALDALIALERLEGEAPSMITTDTDIYHTTLPLFQSVLEIKSFLIMHMIDQKIGKSTMAKALTHILNMALGEVSAVGEKDKKDGLHDADGQDDEDVSDVDADEAGASSMAPGTGGASGGRGRAITSISFLRTLKRLSGASGQDLTKSFLQNWIVGTGIAYFTAGFWYNRKQVQAELVVQQDSPPAKCFTGPLAVRIVETKGTYDSEKRIDRQRRHQWNERVHEKVRKRRRKRQTQIDEEITIEGPGMGQNDTPVLWIKVDHQIKWLRHVVMHQPDYNWAEELVEDTDADAQIQAVRALSYFPVPEVEKFNLTACMAIYDCLMGNKNHSRRLRAEAAKALAVWQLVHAPLTTATSSSESWQGLTLMIRCFKEHFYNNKTHLPHPNYFAPLGEVEALNEEEDMDNKPDIETGNDEVIYVNLVVNKKEYCMAEYEIKKAIPKYISMIRAKNGHSPPEIEKFLLELLRYNDNSQNIIEFAEEGFVEGKRANLTEEPALEDVGDPQSHTGSARKKLIVEDCYYVSFIVLSLSMLTPERKSVPIDGKDEGPVVSAIKRCLHFDSIQRSYGSILSACALQALCNLEISGRKKPNTPYHTYLQPQNHVNVRKAAAESIIRLYCAEDPDKNRTIASSSDICGPAAAIVWLAKFLASEKCRPLRYHAVKAMIGLVSGLPPRTATELLVFAPHAYLREAAEYVDSHIWSKRMVSPAHAVYAELERRMQDLPRSNLVSSLRENVDANRQAVESLWNCMNSTTSAFDQQLRVLLLDLYQTIWSSFTPPCMTGRVKEKSDRWAGGYALLLQLMEQNRQQQKANSHRRGARAGDMSDAMGDTDDDDNHRSRSPADGGKRSRSPAFNTAGGLSVPGLEPFKGKKVKLTLGTTQVRSHKL